jgi:hypothetical protein
MADAEDQAAAPDPTGSGAWVRVGGSRVLALGDILSPLSWFRIVGIPLIAGGLSIARGGGVALFGWVGVVVGFVVIGLVARFLVELRQLDVNLTTNEFRLGSRTRPLSELVTAILTATPATKRGSRLVSLAVGPQRGPRSAFVLRARDGTPIPKETAELLAETVRRSAIAMPENPDDPTGRFARYNYPGHVTREEALALILSPPEPQDPLPLSG